jgi:hypothetical protein
MTRPSRRPGGPVRAAAHRHLAGAGLLALLALGVQACVPMAPRHVGYGEGRPTLVSRDVEVETREAYYASAPGCAYVHLPADAFGPAERRQRVAGALTAHFGPRLGRVVPADRVRAAARALALDPARPGHRVRLARHLDCPAVLRGAPFGGGDLYAGVWSQARVGLAVELRRAADDALLWRARHVATRSAGGLPLSPLAAAGEAVATAAFQVDPEVPASLLHDAARRLAAALPPLPEGARDRVSAPSRTHSQSARLQP